EAPQPQPDAHEGHQGGREEAEGRPPQDARLTLTRPAAGGRLHFFAASVSTSAAALTWSGRVAHAPTTRARSGASTHRNRRPGVGCAGITAPAGLVTAGVANAPAALRGRAESPGGKVRRLNAGRSDDSGRSGTFPAPAGQGGTTKGARH